MNYLKYKLLHTARQLKYKRVASGVPPLTLQNAIAGNLLNYQIYGNSVQDGTPSVDNPVEIESVGDKTKNLFDKNTVTWTDGYFINANGSVVFNTYSSFDASYSSIIELRQNTEYIISGIQPSNASVGMTFTRIHLYDQNGTWIKQLKYAENSHSEVSIQFTTDTNCYIRISLTYEVNKEKDVSELQIEEGTTSTAYEPFGYKIPVTVNNQTTNIYLDEPLRKIGNYADYVDYETQKVVRNVDVIDDTGTLPIEQSLQPLQTPTEETIDLPDIAVSNGTNVIDVATTVAPSNVEIEYYSKEKK